MPAEGETSSFATKAEMPEFTSDFDKQMNAFAQAVGKAAQGNPGFRELIREDVLLRFDGDYDALLKTVATRKIKVSDPAAKTRTGGGGISAGELLDSYFPDEARTRSGGSVIAELQARFPNLQISVPVHAEEWDPEKYTPVVAFLPEDYEDATVEVIPGYDGEGDFVWVDAVNVPDKPVIVVGLSERVDENGELKANSSQATAVVPPTTPTNFKAEVLSSGYISLTWDGADGSYYVLYRKRAMDPEYSYSSRIGTTLKGYTDVDFNFQGSIVYNYYVVSVIWDSNGNMVSSAPSNVLTVQSPPTPGPTTNFKARLSGNYVELLWDRPLDGVTGTFVVASMVPELNQTTYKALVTDDKNVLNNYIYDSPNKGTEVRYKAYRSTPLGTTNPVYTYIYPPYRNANAASPVYIKQLALSDRRIERWPAGEPEFYLKLLGTNNNGGTVELQRQVDIRWDNYVDWDNFNHYTYRSAIYSNKKIYDWRYFADSDWAKALTFSLEEYDRGTKEIKFNIGAKLNTIGIDEITPDVGTSIEVSFSDRGEHCGEAYLNYFDNPETWLVFPNYGVKMLISEKP